MAKSKALRNKITGEFGYRPWDPTWNDALQTARFVNPRLQIMYQFWTKMSDADPAIRREALLRFAVTSMSVKMALEAGWAYTILSDDDEERRKRRWSAYVNRPFDDQMRNQSVFGWRMPHEEGFIGTSESLSLFAFRQSLRVAYEEDGLENAKNAAMRLLKRSPEFGAHQLAGFAMQVGGGFLGKSLFEINLGEAGYSSFRNARIVPDYLLHYVDPEDAVWESTPKAYIKLSKMTGVHPLKLQYVMRNGIGRYYDEMFKVYDSMQGGRIVSQAADLPFLGTLFTREGAGWFSEPVKQVRDEGLGKKAKILEEQLVNMRKKLRIDDPRYEAVADALQLIYTTEQHRGEMNEYANEIKHLRREFYATEDSRRRAEIVDQFEYARYMQTAAASQLIIDHDTIRREIEKKFSEKSP